MISADGGTRTASINGAWVATRLALNKLINKGMLKIDPMKLGFRQFLVELLIIIYI